MIKKGQITHTQPHTCAPVENRWHDFGFAFPDNGLVQLEWG